VEKGREGRGTANQEKVYREKGKYEGHGVGNGDEEKADKVNG
jgi:hypothetical protein